jgi:hypothetical protein
MKDGSAPEEKPAPPTGQVSNAANAEKTTIDVEAKTKS